MSARTIKQVAEQAGCSIATVSRAINAPHLLAPQMLARVREAIAALGFQPNYIGRQLRAERTQLLGVLLPTLSNPVFAECVQGIEAAAEHAGYRLLLMTSRYETQRETHGVQTLLNQRVDGMILTVADARANAMLDRLEREQVPYVLTYNQCARNAAGRPSVSVDNRAASREAVNLLVAQGHRRILMLAGTLHASDRARQRFLGYRDALRAANLAPTAPIEIDFNAERLPEAAMRVLCRRRARATAIFCSNDMLAIVAMRSLRDAGLQVPRDISIVGFDGLPVGELLSPSLATVCQPNREIGARAWTELHERMQGGPARHVILAHRIRAGGSVAPPGAASRQDVSHSSFVFLENAS